MPAYWLTSTGLMLGLTNFILSFISMQKIMKDETNPFLAGSPGVEGVVFFDFLDEPVTPFFDFHSASWVSYRTRSYLPSSVYFFLPSSSRAFHSSEIFFVKMQAVAPCRLLRTSSNTSSLKIMKEFLGFLTSGTGAS